jgi:hypothetical protein
MELEPKSLEGSQEWAPPEQEKVMALEGRWAWMELEMESKGPQEREERWEREP